MITKYKADVVVVGAGLAGITAALELIRKNKKVILLDADIPEKLGGLARWSFGGMFFVNTPLQKKSGIQDSTQLALKDWHTFAEFSEQDIWPKKWAEKYIHESLDMYYWLKQQKVGFFPVVHWVERGLLQPGNSVPRFHMVWGTGQWLVDALVLQMKNDIHASNLTMLFQHTVKELTVTNNRIVGVSGLCTTNNTPFEVEAENTIVASGGICGNIEKVKENWYKPWGSPPKTILIGAHPVADGAMHDKVSELGGNVTHLDKAWHYAAGVHHNKPKFNHHGLSIVPPKSALWLNYEGKRIGPMPLMSAYDTRFLVEQICAQPKKYSWQVLNYKIALKEFAISGADANPAIRDKKLFAFLMNVLFGNKKLVHEMMEECKDFIVAHSLEELTEKMNALQGNNDVKLENIKEAVLSYDETIRRGKKYHNDEQLRRITHLRQYRGDKARVCNHQPIDDKKAYPLIAIREFILSRKTLGGIQTDLQSRVLDKLGKPMLGLYAVGEVAGFGGGGMHGHRSLEGTFLGGCIVTAKAAVEHITN